MTTQTCECNKDILKGVIQECMYCQPYLYTLVDEED